MVQCLNDPSLSLQGIGDERRNMGFRLTAISSKQLERSRRNDVITDVSIARINSKLELMST